MGRPPSDLDDFLDWQERLENYKAGGLEVEVFCLQEGVSRTTFYKWMGRLKDGIPNSMLAEKTAREQAESGAATFVPISLKASPVEIELPNGGIVRLPLGVGQAVLVACHWSGSVSCTTLKIERARCRPTRAVNSVEWKPIPCWIGSKLISLNSLRPCSPRAHWPLRKFPRRPCCRR